MDVLYLHLSFPCQKQSDIFNLDNYFNYIDSHLKKSTWMTVIFALSGQLLIF